MTSKTYEMDCSLHLWWWCVIVSANIVVSEFWVFQISAQRKKNYRNRIADYVFKYIDYLVFLQAMLTRYTFTAVVDFLLLFFLPSGLELTLIDFSVFSFFSYAQERPGINVHNFSDSFIVIQIHSHDAYCLGLVTSYLAIILWLLRVFVYVCVCYVMAFRLRANHIHNHQYFYPPT